MTDVFSLSFIISSLITYKMYKKPFGLIGFGKYDKITIKLHLMSRLAVCAEPKKQRSQLKYAIDFFFQIC